MFLNFQSYQILICSLCLSSASLWAHAQGHDALMDSKGLPELAAASQSDDDDDGIDEELDEDGENAELEALKLSQFELRQDLEYGLGLGLGPVFAWQDLSVNWLEPISEYSQWGVTLGRGSFEISENNDVNTFLIDATVYSAYGFYRRYFGDFPIFWQVDSGLAYWAGSVRPRSNDQIIIDETNSLVSDFSAINLNLSASLRFSWTWTQRVYLEFSVIQFGVSQLIQEEYTKNDSSARDLFREQVQGLHSWSGINLLLGYRF